MRANRWASLWCVWAVTAWAGEVELTPRRSNAADLTPRFERYVTANGLVVVLSPDPLANGVVVDLSFAAGAVYHPAGKAGLAHLVEHVFASGSTPETNYRELLEQRGAVGFNALTTFDRMSFRVTVPPEELPLALWVNADRLGSLGPALTQEELSRHQRVVLQERLHRIDDAPYGGNGVALMRALFPEGHPLRAGVMGAHDEIASLTLADVTGFQSRLMVPANGVLVLTGNFEPAVARAWVEKTLALLPPGKAAGPPPPTPSRTVETRVAVKEELGRRPMVTLAWTFSDPITEVCESLEFGSLLLTIYTDGFVGMNVGSTLMQYTGGAVFMINVAMPHATGKLEAAGNAEVVFRYLSQVTMPSDLVRATLLAWDRNLMELLESNDARATLLTQLEVRPPDPIYGLVSGERHWSITPQRIQDIAGAALRGKRVEIQSRPTRPLPPRLDR